MLSFMFFYEAQRLHMAWLGRSPAQAKTSLVPCVPSSVLGEDLYVATCKNVQSKCGSPIADPIPKHDFSLSIKFSGKVRLVT